MKYKEALISMVEQFAYPVVVGGIPAISTGGLSALEEAFQVLNMKDPHLVPERKCQIEGCSEHATCGTPTKNGYKRLCYKHFNGEKQGE